MVGLRRASGGEAGGAGRRRRVGVRTGSRSSWRFASVHSFLARRRRPPRYSRLSPTAHLRPGVSGYERVRNRMRLCGAAAAPLAACVRCGGLAVSLAGRVLGRRPVALRVVGSARLHRLPPAGLPDLPSRVPDGVARSGRPRRRRALRLVAAAVGPRVPRPALACSRRPPRSGRGLPSLAKWLARSPRARLVAAMRGRSGPARRVRLVRPQRPRLPPKLCRLGPRWTSPARSPLRPPPASRGNGR